MPENWKKKWFCSKVQELKAPMWGLAIGLMKHPQDAEDAIQNALMLAYEHIDELSFAEKFKPWIMRILTNECYRLLKKRKLYVDIDEVYDLQDEHSGFDEDVTLWQVVENLKLEYRTVILLFYYEGMSIRQIAHTLDLSEDNVKKRLSRARGKLREYLEKEDL